MRQQNTKLTIELLKQTGFSAEVIGDGVVRASLKRPITTREVDDYLESQGLEHFQYEVRRSGGSVLVVLS